MFTENKIAYKIQNFYKIKFMKTINSDSVALLKQLKHKRFSSDFCPTNLNTQITFQSSYGKSTGSSCQFYPTSKPVGFSCSYHPTQKITNFCLSQNQKSPKPLCPRCLQQHMKNHQMSQGLHTACRLQTCDVQIQKMSQMMQQKLSKCQSLSQKIEKIGDFRVKNMNQVRQELDQYKQQIHQTIQKAFQKLTTQINKKWDQQNRQFIDASTTTTQLITNLTQTCLRSLDLIKTQKEINSITLSLSEIYKTFQSLKALEDKLTNAGLNKLQVMINRNKNSDLISNVKSVIQTKASKLTESQLQKSFKSLKLQRGKSQLQKSLKLQRGKSDRINENTPSQNKSRLSQLQKHFESKSQGQLFSIENNSKNTQVNNLNSKMNSFSKYGIHKSSNNHVKSNNHYQDVQNPTSGLENATQRIMDRLNDTSNKLKSSLNGFNKTKKLFYG